MAESTSDAHGWLPTLISGLDPLSTAWPPSAQRTRRAAVLILLSDTVVPDVVLTLRAATLHHHAGQVSLPGGHREWGDISPASTALRETTEEIGLEPHLVHTLGQLPTREVKVSRNLVIPVVGLWSGKNSLVAVDSHEVDAVLRWSVTDLAEPTRRLTARHPGGGSGPAWVIDDLFLWGLTGYMIDALLRAGGWERPWRRERMAEVPPRFRQSGRAR